MRQNPTGIAVAVALAALSCSPSALAFALPRHNVPAQGASGVATEGTIRFDSRCVWLEFDGGAANLLWPESFSATAPPLEIRGVTGKVVIREGDEVVLGVSEARALVPGCPGRPVWLVGEIASVNGVTGPDDPPVPRPTAPRPMPR